ncbi:hypothetical protein F5J12DRAFT_940073 [Pisolithus orientalis]|uniref:uncharacterized protein n=1 Tax=Pisolithus orientalis TaxID=936130 RepID=UPI002224CF88|nr:uncharacterized protein F5J12DRAFT_940073 [Pisolithus orientalis]KAI6006297.1 hypothetical protein F5J12DRAFT_940073 [Pisolithus orientalis]
MQRVYGRKGRRTTREPRLPETETPTDTDDNDSPSPGRRKRRKITVEASPLTATPDGSPSKRPQTPIPDSSQVKGRLQSSTPTRKRQATPDDLAQSPSKQQPLRPMKTYAGPSRSFLVNLPISSLDLDNLHDQTQEDMSQESYTDLRNRWGVDKSEDDPLPFEPASSPSRRLKRTSSASFQTSLGHNSNGAPNDLKSITELRNKGESRRFMDEVGYLFEGLEMSSAMALRRTSALEIVNKLCDPDFNRRAKAFDFYVLTWDKLSISRGGVSDKIFDAILSFFAALSSRDPHTLGDLSRRPDFADTLVDILVSLRDKTDVLSLAAANAHVTDFKACGISRSEILVLKNLSGMVSEELHEGSESQPSVRTLVSHTLAMLPATLAARHLDPILASLEAELSLVGPRITAYLSGLPLLPVPSELCSAALSLEHLESCLRLVDSFLLGQWSTANLEDDRAAVFRVACADELASKFLSLCVLSQVQLRESENEDQRILAWKCLCGALRVLTLLSHGDLSWCEATLVEEYSLPFVALVAIQSQSKWLENGDQHPGGETFDLLCLALGLLMNWATMSEKVSGLCREQCKPILLESPICLLAILTAIDPSCPGNRPCIRACQCSERQSILRCLTALYVQHTSTHEDSPPENVFLRGYTAVLLGILIKGNKASLDVVLAALSAESSSAKLRSLICHCHAFLDSYKQTMTSLNEGTTSLASRDSRDRRKGSWDKSGEEIARGVIASLESLCSSS